MDRRFTRLGQGRSRSSPGSRSVRPSRRRPSPPPASWEALESRRLMCLQHLVDSGHLSLWGVAPAAGSPLDAGAMDAGAMDAASPAAPFVGSVSPASLSADAD